MIINRKLTNHNLKYAIDRGLITHVDKNPLFENMCQRLRIEKSDYVTIEEGEICTAVAVLKNSFKLHSHNHLTLSLPDNSHIRITPTFDNNVEITRIISNKKGFGTLMMRIVLYAYFISVSHDLVDTTRQFENSTLVLECTGSVGAGENKRDMDIKDQMKFFRKFGFRLKGKYNPRYVKMELSHNEDFVRQYEEFATKFIVWANLNKK